MTVHKTNQARRKTPIPHRAMLPRVTTRPRRIDRATRIGTKADRIAAVAAIFEVDVVAGVVAGVRIVEVVEDAVATGVMAENCPSPNMPRTARTRILPANLRRPKATFRRSFPANLWQNTKPLHRRNL